MTACLPVVGGGRLVDTISHLSFGLIDLLLEDPLIDQFEQCGGDLYGLQLDLRTKKSPANEPISQPAVLGLQLPLLRIGPASSAVWVDKINMCRLIVLPLVSATPRTDREGRLSYETSVSFLKYIRLCWIIVKVIYDDIK